METKKMAYNQQKRMYEKETFNPKGSMNKRKYIIRKKEFTNT